MTEEQRLRQIRDPETYIKKVITRHDFNDDVVFDIVRQPSQFTRVSQKFLLLFLCNSRAALLKEL